MGRAVKAMVVMNVVKVDVLCNLDVSKYYVVHSCTLTIFDINVHRTTSGWGREAAYKEHL